MPGGVSIDNLGDLLNTTLPFFPKSKFTETQKYTDYPLTRMLFAEGKQTVQAGKWHETRVRYRSKSTAEMTRLYGTMSRQIVDTMLTLTTPWRYYQDSTDYDEREVDINGPGATQTIVDLMQTRESATEEGIANLLEEQACQAPSTSSDDGDLYGVLYWARPLATSTTDTTGGFNGQTPLFRDGTQTGNTAGQDASTAANARLRNWAATHSGEMTPETLKTIRRAMTGTGFKTLDGLTGKTAKSGGERAILMDHAYADQFEDMVNKGPDDLGGKLIRFTDPSIRSVKIVRTPVFASVSYAPIVGIYTKHLYGIVLKDNWMKRSKAINSREQPFVWTVPIQGVCNIVCDNMREGVWIVHAVRS